MGIKLNLPKCNFFRIEIEFLGKIYAENKVRIDPGRVEAIQKMPPPTNITELQRFLGVVNYLRSFIPNLSEKTDNLGKLLKKRELKGMVSNSQR